MRGIGTPTLQWDDLGGFRVLVIVLYCERAVKLMIATLSWICSYGYLMTLKPRETVARGTKHRQAQNAQSYRLFEAKSCSISSLSLHAQHTY